ncbi:MAG: hypothetical protein HUJ56_03150, partial [Erysipelotrichaceae bacterium]|nr:hypothetical protein [Erysipelotrichaceae bacterium]
YNATNIAIASVEKKAEAIQKYIGRERLEYKDLEDERYIQWDYVDEDNGVILTFEDNLEKNPMGTLNDNPPRMVVPDRKIYTQHNSIHRDIEDRCVECFVCGKGGQSPQVMVQQDVDTIEEIFLAKQYNEADAMQFIWPRCMEIRAHASLTNLEKCIKTYSHYNTWIDAGSTILSDLGKQTHLPSEVYSNIYSSKDMDKCMIHESFPATGEVILFIHPNTNVMQIIHMCSNYGYIGTVLNYGERTVYSIMHLSKNLIKKDGLSNFSKFGLISSTTILHTNYRTIDISYNRYDGYKFNHSMVFDRNGSDDVITEDYESPELSFIRNNGKIVSFVSDHYNKYGKEPVLYRDINGIPINHLDPYYVRAESKQETTN